MKKIALVTGGSGGIGSAVCRSLSSAGWTVGVGYFRNKAGAEALAAEIGGYPAYADVSRPEEVEAMFAEAGEVELLVSNAGIAHYGLITDLSYGDWRELMAVNLDGAFLCCRAAVPGMVRRKKGNIVIVSSMWGQVGASCEAAYSASKSGLIGLTKALAKELAPSGIRVNCVAPGVVRTPMLKDFSEEDLENLRLETPLERLGEPEDVAELVGYLASEKSRFMTGQVIGLNGGFVIT
jgi:3-oxoacyl-[acyl-carrier protein] reductase